MRLRVRHTKRGKVRFTSSRDAARIWERALRRTGLPVAMSEGFTPRPKISFGLALPVGAESVAEYVDIDLRPDVRAADVDLDSLAERLSAALPVGFDVLVAAVRPPGKGSLQDSVTACTWEFTHPRLTAGDHRQACALLDAPTLVIERERKAKRSADDVRPLILDLRYADHSESASFEPDVPALDASERFAGCLVADLATVGRGLRPSELAELAYPGLDARDVRALRTHQWIDAVDPITNQHGPGCRREVLPLTEPAPRPEEPVGATRSTDAVPA